MIQILLQGLKVLFVMLNQRIPLTHPLTDGSPLLASLLRSRSSSNSTLAVALSESLILRQVCAIINSCFLPFTEGLAPFRELARIGPLIMLSNAGVAFGLNVAAVFLIGTAGGLVLTLAGVFKVSGRHNLHSRS